MVPLHASSAARRYARYIAGAAFLLLAYAIVVPLVASTEHVVKDGPLSLSRPAAAVAPSGSHVRLEAVESACNNESAISSADHLKVVAATLDGRPYFACYGLSSSGRVTGAGVFDGDAVAVHDSALIKKSGAWRWIGTVKTTGELVLGAFGMVAIAVLCFIYYRRPRPGPVAGGTGFRSRVADGVLVAFGPIGWIAVALDKQRPRDRKIRLVLMSIVGFSAVACMGLLASVSEYPDALGFAVGGLLCAEMAF